MYKIVLGLLYLLVSGSIFLLVDLKTVINHPGLYELGVHLVSSIALTLIFCAFMKRYKKIEVIALMLFHIGLPVFSLFFCLSIIATFVLTKKMDLLGGYHEEDQAISSSLKQVEIKGYEESIQDQMNVEPLVETVRGLSGPEMKRGAIETLTQLETPEAVSLLKECLHDDNSEVRFYAASGLSKIEGRLNSVIVEFKQKLEEQGESMQDHYDLARAYYQFIYLEMQDKASLSYYLEKAIEHFKKAMEYPNAPRQVQMDLQRAYTYSGNYEEARRIHEANFDMKLQESSNILYLAENYFREGRFKECQELIEFSRQHKTSWSNVRDIQKLWLEIQSREAKA